MVNDKGKDVVSSPPSLSSELNDAANISQSEMTVSVPVTMNIEKTGVVSQSEDKEENTVKEVTNEENAIVVMTNGKIAIEEEKNEETAMEEVEEHEETSTEEDEEDEPYALGDDDDYEYEVDADGDEEEKEEEENEIEDEDEAHEEVEEEKEEENKKKANQQAKNKEKVEANSNEQVKKSRKRGRKKVARGVTERVASQLEDKPGSSSQRKMPKRVESMGMIFMCSSKTKKDCFFYKVLGLPESKRDIVQKIYKGMRLFLFDLDLRLMYGIYKAAAPGGYNIEPNAFKSAFPSQVRFTILDDCLPLAEEKFRTVIKDNYYTRNKFDCQLNSKQVKNLCKLFRAASKGSKSEKSGRKSRGETHRFVSRDRIRMPDKAESSALGVDRDRIRMPDKDKRSALRVDRDRIRRSDREKRSALRVDQDRIRRPDREKRSALRVDRDRIRRPHREKRSALRAAQRYRDRPVMFERERFASPEAPPPRFPPLPPPPAPAPLYVSSYGRTLEVDPYRRVVERRDHRLLDSDIRYRDEFARRVDPYISYREPPSYRDHMYPASLPPEYNPPAVGLQAEYPPPAGPRYEHRYPAAPSSEYDLPLRPLYRY
ncbi:B2 protein [Actinidia chinensis var. chinensis]|uniref:B2 protein n=1 Tax=Actinidia chinensis var. chinensis TaxID=1590841 RepID=A0A2R6PFA9_ACTCC|nr:B2 protein [Actinidia chinensis var. chinensis]